MELGVHFWNFDLSGGDGAIAPTLGATAAAAEEVGCSTFSMMDHFFQMEGWAPATDPCLEGYTSLGYVAAVTSSIRLSLLVTGVTYRHPGLLAKIVTTLDVLSSGRAMLGIGAAWYEREHLGLGVAFPPLAERFDRLEETLQIARQMWSDDDGPYEGRYYQLAETICRPRPIGRRAPTVLIGGGGERRTLRLVAQYGDACNLFSDDPDVVAHKLDVLRRHCDEVGRDYDEIEKTVAGAGDPFGDPDGFLALMERLAPLGITMAVLMPKGDDQPGAVRALGETVIPKLAEIG